MLGAASSLLPPALAAAASAASGPILSALGSGSNLRIEELRAELAEVRRSAQVAELKAEQAKRDQQLADEQREEITEALAHSEYRAALEDEIAVAREQQLRFEAQSAETRALTAEVESKTEIHELSEVEKILDHQLRKDQAEVREAAAEVRQEKEAFKRRSSQARS